MTTAKMTKINSIQDSNTIPIDNKLESRKEILTHADTHIGTDNDGRKSLLKMGTAADENRSKKKLSFVGMEPPVFDSVPTKPGPLENIQELCGSSAAVVVRSHEQVNQIQDLQAENAALRAMAADSNLEGRHAILTHANTSIRVDLLDNTTGSSIKPNAESILNDTKFKATDVD
eukprot:Filipodium_phascolosomae@DN2800_c0_g2_i4.p1